MKLQKAGGKLDAAAVPVAHCHEMVEDSAGRLILFQTHTKNNIVIYDKGGKLLETWGTAYKGAHGLDIVNENGEEFLFLTDTSRGKVFKTRLDGKVVMEMGRPDLPQYADKSAAYPAHQCHACSRWDLLCRRWLRKQLGHSSRPQMVRFSMFSEVKGTRPESLNVPHGGIVDTRNPKQPSLMICSRSDSAVKRFTMSGIHLQTIPIPGMKICQLARRENYMVAAHLDGLLSVIDENHQVVSNPGGSAPKYESWIEIGGTQKGGRQSFHPSPRTVDR